MLLAIKGSVCWSPSTAPAPRTVLAVLRRTGRGDERVRHLPAREGMPQLHGEDRLERADGSEAQEPADGGESSPLPPRRRCSAIARFWVSRTARSLARVQLARREAREHLLARLALRNVPRLIHVLAQPLRRDDGAEQPRGFLFGTALLLHQRDQLAGDEGHGDEQRRQDDARHGEEQFVMAVGVPGQRRDRVARRDAKAA